MWTYINDRLKPRDVRVMRTYMCGHVHQRPNKRPRCSCQIEMHMDNETRGHRGAVSTAPPAGRSARLHMHACLPTCKNSRQACPAKSFLMRVMGPPPFSALSSAFMRAITDTCFGFDLCTTHACQRNKTTTQSRK